MKIHVSAILLLSLLATILMPSVTLASKDDAGETIGDSIYVDNKYDFSFKKPDHWKFKDIHKNKEVERVFMLQDNPTVPAQYVRFRELFTQPQITILAYDVKKSPKDYVDFLLSDEGKDELKDKAKDKFLMFQQDSKYSFEHSRPRFIRVGDHHGVKIVGKKRYSYQTEETGAISDYLVGYIYIIDSGKGLVLIECACEREMQDDLIPDFDEVIDSFTFPDTGKNTDTGDKPGEE